MKKFFKIFNIISSLIICSFIIQILIICILYFPNFYYTNGINNYMGNYPHKNNVIYYNNECLIYKNQRYNMDYKILYIDDTSIIKYRYEKFYIEDINSIRECNNLETNYTDSLTKRNNLIYYKYSKNIYRSYDIITNKNKEISEEKYYELKFGNKYKIEIDNSAKNITITNNITKELKEISHIDLYNIELLKQIDSHYSVKTIDLCVHNDNILLYLNIKNKLGYILIYNFDDNSFDYYDWFNNMDGTNTRFSLCNFYFIGNTNSPILKYISI